MRLLVAEDAPVLSHTLVKGLEAEQFKVDLVQDGEAGLGLATEKNYNAIILDSKLPNMDGLSVVRQLRRAGKANRILMLTNADDTEDRISGLQAGADDCMAKPVVFAELLARLNSLLRRPEELIDKLRVDDLELDRMKHKVTRDGKTITLTQREYGVLEYLMRNAGCPVTRTMVVEHVWNLDFEGFTNIVDVYINYLRAKVDRGFKRPLIRTARGIGYVLSAGD